MPVSALHLGGASHAGIGMTCTSQGDICSVAGRCQEPSSGINFIVIIILFHVQGTFEHLSGSGSGRNFPVGRSFFALAHRISLIHLYTW